MEPTVGQELDIRVRTKSLDLFSSSVLLLLAPLVEVKCRRYPYGDDAERNQYQGYWVVPNGYVWHSLSRVHQRQGVQHSAGSVAVFVAGVPPAAFAGVQVGDGAGQPFRLVGLLGTVNGVQQ